MGKKTELFHALVLWSMLHTSIHLEWQRVCQTPLQDKSKTYEKYVWNKSDMSLVDYQQKFCEMRCKGNELITYRVNKCWDLECIQCHCERPACEHYRICCPDISVPFDRRGVVLDDSFTTTTVKHLNETEAKNRSTAPALGCDYHPGLDHRFMFIRSCQADYDDNQTVIDLCEMDRQPQEQTIETFIKVVDLERQTVYRNKFCALCNHVTNTISSWNSAHFCPADYLKLELCPLLPCRLSQVGILPTSALQTISSLNSAYFCFADYLKLEFGPLLSCRLSQVGILPTSALQTISSLNSAHFCPADYLKLELCPLLPCRLSQVGILPTSVLQTISSWNSAHFCSADVSN
ncbi:adhesion G protein-coupled receptor L3 [Biomphalaria glabrata]|nr:hypothetical protein BgiMline_004591 [Biomphalaria glabrata]